MIENAKIDGLLAWGSLHSADFYEKTLEFRIEGDMPVVRRGRYAIIDAERLRILIMQANLWREQSVSGSRSSDPRHEVGSARKGGRAAPEEGQRPNNPTESIT